MRLVAESGLWRTGPPTPDTPLAAVLEVSGAVLSWPIDDPPGPGAQASVQMTFTDVRRADWLWRVLGESGHVALASSLGAIDGAVDPAHHIELGGIDILPGSVDPLRRLAIGHWLRRWWPASRQDGIAGLDRAVLDVEVALLTAAAQDFFDDDTLDSDVAGLLAPHAAALITHVAAGDPRVVDLVRAGAGLADDIGVYAAHWPELFAALEDSNTMATFPSDRRDDYALAAGRGAGLRGAAAPARGVASINWGGVPPAIFDAAENTVEWSIESSGTAVVAVVRAAVIGPDPATGIAVRLRSGAIGGAGILDAEGHARVALADAGQQALAESAAWNRDWSATSVLIGAETTESPETRDRVRRWARARLDLPPRDAFLAEILAAESTY